MYFAATHGVLKLGCATRVARQAVCQQYAQQVAGSVNADKQLALVLSRAHIALDCGLC